MHVQDNSCRMWLSGPQKWLRKLSASIIVGNGIGSMDRPTLVPTKVVKSWAVIKIYRAHINTSRTVSKVRSKSCASSSCGAVKLQADFGASFWAIIIGNDSHTPNSHPNLLLGARSKKKVSRQKPWRLSTPDTLRGNTLRFQEFQLTNKRTSHDLRGSGLAKPDFRLGSWSCARSALRGGMCRAE